MSTDASTNNANIGRLALRAIKQRTVGDEWANDRVSASLYLPSYQDIGKDKSAGRLDIFLRDPSDPARELFFGLITLPASRRRIAEILFTGGKLGGQYHYWNVSIFSEEHKDLVLRLVEELRRATGAGEFRYYITPNKPSTNNADIGHLALKAIKQKAVGDEWASGRIRTRFSKPGVHRGGTLTLFMTDPSNSRKHWLSSLIVSQTPRHEIAKISFETGKRGGQYHYWNVDIYGREHAALVNRLVEQLRRATDAGEFRCFVRDKKA